MEYYIKKNDVVSLLMKEAKSHGLSFSAEAYERAANIVTCMPNENVQPVKYAKWILFDKDNMGRAFYCSNCRKATTTEDFEKSPLENEEYFCPRCGSRMDGDAE